MPKFGDPNEFPLTPDEIDVLRTKFRVDQSYPEMCFFRLIPTYLFRHRFEAPFVALDELFYRREWWLRASYRQYVFLERRA